MGGAGDGSGGGGNAGEPLRVAAASDLQVAFAEIASTFERESGHKVVVSFGATGLLARQIPDEEKRRRADFVVDTGIALDQTLAGQLLERGHLIADR